MRTKALLPAWNMMRGQSLSSRPRREYQIAQGLAGNHQLGKLRQAFRDIPCVRISAVDQVGYAMYSMWQERIKWIEWIGNYLDWKSCSLTASFPHGAYVSLERKGDDL